MVKDELIIREQDQQDRRKVVLNLSEEGIDKFKKEKENLVEKLSNWISNFTEEEKDKFIKSSEFIVEHLSEV